MATIAAMVVCGVWFDTLVPISDTTVAIAAGACVCVALWCLACRLFTRSFQFDLHSVFWAGLLLFNGGQIMLRAVGTERLPPLFSRFSDYHLVKMILLVAIGLLAAHCGASVAALRCTMRRRNPGTTSELRGLRITAYLVLFVTVGPWLATTWDRLVAVMSLGYFYGSFRPEVATGIAHAPVLLALGFDAGIILL